MKVEECFQLAIVILAIMFSIRIYIYAVAIEEKVYRIEQQISDFGCGTKGRK